LDKNKGTNVPFFILKDK